MPEYRLDREQWIPVVGVDGAERTVSLVDVFERAADLTALTGSPLEVAAIARLLLGIAQLTDTPPTLQAWKALWDDRSRFMRSCADYVREREGTWDLFHHEKPFLQDPRLAGVHVGGVEVGPCAVEPVEPTFLNRGKLGTDSFVWHPAGEDVELTPAQAARAVLVTHAFAMGGTGTPNRLIPKTKAGQDDKYSRNSLLAQKLVAFIHQAPLDEFLMLNLLAGVEVGRPGWECAPVTSRKPVPCAGIADRYTRPAVALLLYPDSRGRVSRATVTLGPSFEAADVEGDPFVPHVMVKDDGYSPLRLERARALWRSSHTLLSCKGKPLPVVDQLRRLADRGYVTCSTAGLRVVGIGGTLGKVKHHLWRDETLPFGMSVLTDDARYAALERAVTGAEDRATKLGGRLYQFALAYLRNGGDSSPDPKDARPRRLAAELAPDLADFWSDIGPRGERIALDDFDDAAWEKELAAASGRAFRKAIDRLPPDARRLRAEFARAEAGQDTPKGGKKTA